MKKDDIITVPTMRVIADGVIVHRPTAEAQPPIIGEFGAVSVGAEQVPVLGAVMHVAVHERDGSTVLLTLTREALRDFTLLCNECITKIAAGDYDQPEVRH